MGGSASARTPPRINTTLCENNATSHTCPRMSVHPDKTSIYRPENNRDPDVTIEEATCPGEEALKTAAAVLRPSAARWTLTVDPYVGGAFCRTPLIGGLACVQSLVLPCDPINVEAAVLSGDQDA